MSIASILMIHSLSYFHQSAAALTDEDYNSYLTQWVTEFLLVVWKELLKIDYTGITALKQMLYLHLPSGPCFSELPDPSHFSGDITSEDISDLIIGLIARKEYSVRARAALFHTAEYFGHEVLKVKRIEGQIGRVLESIVADRGGKSKFERRWKLGLAAIGGGAALALTGGLAAPLLAAGFTAVGSSITALGPLGVVLGGAVATTGGLIGGIGVPGAVFLFGTAGSTLTGIKMSKRWGDLEEFELKKIPSASNNPDQQLDECVVPLEITILVSGWLEEGETFEDQWLKRGEPHTSSTTETKNSLHHANKPSTIQLTDEYLLKWESTQLCKLGSVLRKLIRNEVARTLASLWLSAALGASLTTLMWPVAVLNSLSDLDNTWLVVKDRAKLTGEVLASVVSENVGTRPVTLIGFSMGAKVVFECLQVLHARKRFGIVNEAVLLGAPISLSSVSVSGIADATGLGAGHSEYWRRARSVVAGRFVNGYSSNDWLLGVLSRYMDWGIAVAGLSPVEEVGVENVDCGSMVSVHTEWGEKIDLVLQQCGVTRLSA